MEWLSAFFIINLIGISANLDNTGVGIAYGLKDVRLPCWFNMIINMIGFLNTLIGVFLASAVSRFISPEATGLVSFSVFVCIGLATIYHHYSFLLYGTGKSSVKIKEPGWRQAVLLGFTLSLTNIAAGFGTAVAYESLVWHLAISITFWGYICIWVGNAIGKTFFSKILGRYSSLVAGLIFIALGFNQLW